MEKSLVESTLLNDRVHGPVVSPLSRFSGFAASIDKLQTHCISFAPDHLAKLLVRDVGHQRNGKAIRKLHVAINDDLRPSLREVGQ